jgi:hypothetical protein
MPTVAVVEGVKIVFYYGDHPPPHFHAKLAENDAVIGLRDVKLLAGGLPPAKLSAVMHWAATRQPELWTAWNAAQQEQVLARIS